MTLSDVLDRLEALGDEPLCIGMNSYEGRHCAAAHMLILVIGEHRYALLYKRSRHYDAFERVFGFPASEVYKEIDPLTMHEKCTAAQAARRLRELFDERRGWLDRSISLVV